MDTLTRDIRALKVGQSFVTYRLATDAWASARYLRKQNLDMEITVSEGWLVFQDGATEKVRRITRISKQDARDLTHTRQGRPGIAE